jgi:hypothetical protein
MVFLVVKIERTATAVDPHPVTTVVAGSVFSNPVQLGFSFFSGCGNWTFKH